MTTCGRSDEDLDLQGDSHGGDRSCGGGGDCQNSGDGKKSSGCCSTEKEGGGCGGDGSCSTSAEGQPIQPASKSLCYKCQSRPSQLVYRDHGMCGPCFCIQVLHKFKVSLKHDLRMKRHDKVMVAFSGGPSSTAMLELFARGLEADALTGRQMCYEFDLLYVDDGAVLGMSQAERQAIVDEVKKACASYKAKLHIRNLEDVLDLHSSSSSSSSSSSANSSSSSSSSTERLVQLFDSLRDTSDKVDLHRVLLRRLLADTAKANGCSKLVCGDNATRFAANVIAATAKGRGFELSFDLQAVDERFGVSFVHPLRDDLSKAFAFYNHFNNLHAITKPSLLTGLRREKVPGVNALCEGFLANLQSKFSNTIYNILRTSQKLTLPDLAALATQHSANTGRADKEQDTEGKEEAQGEGQLLVPCCSLCERPISRTVSDSAHSHGQQIGSSASPSSASASSSSSASVPSSSSSPSSSSVQFCYGCASLIPESLFATDLLPPFMTEPASLPIKPVHSGKGQHKHNTSSAPAPVVKQTRQQMRESIQEFILPE